MATTNATKEVRIVESRRNIKHGVSLENSRALVSYFFGKETSSLETDYS